MESKEQGKQAETKEQVRDIVASRYGYKKWKDIDWYELDEANKAPLNGKYMVDILQNEVIETYASLRVSEAVEAKDKEIAELKAKVEELEKIIQESAL